MRRLAALVDLVAGALLILPARIHRRLRPKSARVLIGGWYGSETLGDIAILGQTISEVRAALPGIAIECATFNRSRTAASLAQLDEATIRLVSGPIAVAWRRATSRIFLFGGGPLMESPSMLAWALQAMLARASGARVIVYSCGIGPIRSRLADRSIQALLRVSHLNIVRDSASADLVRGTAGAEVSFDPAFDWVRDHRPNAPLRSQRVALALRFPPPTYLNTTREGAARWHDHFVTECAAALDTLAAKGITFTAVIMNSDSGEDDREVYDSILSRMQRPDALQVAAGSHSLNHAIASMAAAEAVLAVRFHGLVFALALGRPCVAVDYAVPRGKISAAATDAGVPNWVIGANEVDRADLVQRVERAIGLGRFEPPPTLLAASARRIGLLKEALAAHDRHDPIRAP